MTIFIVAKYRDLREQTISGYHGAFVTEPAAEHEADLLNTEIENSQDFDPETDELYDVYTIKVLE